MRSCFATLAALALCGTGYAADAAKPVKPAKDAARALRLGAVCGGPKAVSVFRGIRYYFAKNGVPVEYVVFPDEGHGFIKKENEIRGYGAVLAFLDKHLKSVAPAGGAAAN